MATAPCLPAGEGHAISKGWCGVMAIHRELRRPLVACTSLGGNPSFFGPRATYFSFRSTQEKLDCQLRFNFGKAGHPFFNFGLTSENLGIQNLQVWFNFGIIGNPTFAIVVQLMKIWKCNFPALVRLRESWKSSFVFQLWFDFGNVRSPTLSKSVQHRKSWKS